MANLSLAGRLGSDAASRTIQSGKQVIQFNVAFDTGFGDRKTTTWVRCSYWRTPTDKLMECLTKGALVFVSGEPSLSTYEGKEGQRTSLELNVQSLKLLGGKRDEPVADRAKATSRDLDDDLPF